MKEKEKRLALEMRKDGASITKIANYLKVSKGSVSNWVRDVNLTDEQIETLRVNHGLTNGRRIGSIANRDKAEARRLSSQNKGRQAIIDCDKDYLAGCMLYWAEGNKSKSIVSFTNSDIEMMRFFIGFLRKYFCVDESRFGFSVNCYLSNGKTKDEVENFWMKALSLSRDNIKKGTFKKADSSYSGRKHIYGVVRLYYADTDMVQQIFGSIQEYVGFTQREWI